MREDIDETDIRLISELLKNGRISAKSLAKKAGIHPNTLLFRVKRLEKQGIIRNYSARIDFSKLGYSLHFIVLLKFPIGGTMDTGRLKDILEAPELESFHKITGNWDAITHWRVRDREHFNSVLNKISMNPMVERTSSQLILQTFKDYCEFNPLSLKSES